MEETTLEALTVQGTYDNVPIHGVTWLKFINDAVKKDDPTVIKDSWNSEHSFQKFKGIKDFKVLSLSEDRAYSQFYIYATMNDALIYVNMSTSVITVNVVAKSKTAAEKIIKKIRKECPETKRPEKQSVGFNTWYMTKNGPVTSWKEIAVPQWKEIKDNYTSPTKTALNELISNFRGEETAGQLILWRGAPGGGKTYALRSLMWQWREKVQTHYIADCDVFFNDPGYMMDVLTDGQTQEWKLIVVEDGGELLASDARNTMRQGLSRLLNLVDGLMGQHSKIIVLITTNEPIETMHPAVIRSGRCMANTEFLPLSLAEAQKWCKKNGVDIQRLNEQSSWMISDLYALKNNTARINLNERREKVYGFVAPNNMRPPRLVNDPAARAK